MARGILFPQPAIKPMPHPHSGSTEPLITGRPGKSLDTQTNKYIILRHHLKRVKESTLRKVHFLTSLTPEQGWPTCSMQAHLFLQINIYWNHSQAHLFACYMWLLPHALHQQSWTGATENVWPTKPKIYTIWFFIESLLSLDLEGACWKGEFLHAHLLFIQKSSHETQRRKHTQTWVSEVGSASVPYKYASALLWGHGKPRHAPVPCTGHILSVEVAKSSPVCPHTSPMGRWGKSGLLFLYLHPLMSQELRKFPCLFLIMLLQKGHLYPILWLDDSFQFLKLESALIHLEDSCSEHWLAQWMSWELSRTRTPRLAWGEGGQWDPLWNEPVWQAGTLAGGLPQEVVLPSGWLRVGTAVGLSWPPWGLLGCGRTLYGGGDWEPGRRLYSW